MAINETSRLEFELQRFLSRYPKLASVPQLNSRLKQGQSLIEEEVVNTVAELFLHPSYTIPLTGCFRSMAKMIVEKVVALLRLVPDLRSNSHGSVEEFEEDKIFQENEYLCDVVDIVDYYVRNGRALVLHELACLAFCRVLDLAPFLLGSVLGYFKFAPPPFARIMQRESFSELSKRAGTCYLLNVVRASYRLLLLQPEVFSTLWDWSCFLDLLKQCLDFDPGDNVEFLKNVSDIRWCGIQILSIILKINDKATANFGLTAEEAFPCLLRWDEFCQDVSLEKAGWYLDSPGKERSSFVDGNTDFEEEYNHQNFRSGSLALSASECHAIVSSKRHRRDVNFTLNPFVLTPAMKKSFEMVCLALEQKWPVLLYGPAGAGKTKLISELARESGSQGVYLFFHQFHTFARMKFRDLLSFTLSTHLM
ncbi:hypothetical protein NMG60_11004091 [Bertholletia excelsa]